MTNYTSSKKTSSKKIVKRKSISDLQSPKSYKKSLKSFIKKNRKKIIGAALLTTLLASPAISNYYKNKSKEKYSISPKDRIMNKNVLDKIKNMKPIVINKNDPM